MIYKETISDILVLNMLDSRPTYTSDPYKIFDGFTHENEADSNHIRLPQVVKRLENNNFIRENKSKELLLKLTNLELKELLKKYNQPVTGAKQILITRIENYITDEDINAFTKKRYYVLTDNGISLLKKYKNVIWIQKNKKKIFLEAIDGGEKIDLDKHYFFKYWNVEPQKQIIDYYKDKNDLIVSRTYSLMKDYENVIYYSIKYVTSIFNKYICGEIPSTKIDLLISYFYISRVNELKKDIEMSDEDFHSLIYNIYVLFFEYKNSVNYSSFEKMIDILIEGKEYSKNKLNEVFGINVENSKDLTDTLVDERIVDNPSKEEIIEAEAESLYDCLTYDFDFYLEVYSVFFSKMNEDEINEFKNKLMPFFK